MKQKFVVITTINAPSKGIELFAKNTDYQVLVIGDKKTPANWSHPNTLFLYTEQQLDLDYQILEHLPFNHYARKMIGYVYAIKNNAAIIFDTDDDNIPKPNWRAMPEGESFLVTNSKKFVNIYQYFTTQKIWPRGFPLNHLHQSLQPFEPSSQKKEVKVGVWQGLADEDPDVDAIYRLTDDTPCYFEDKEPLVLETGSVCPFNSQNTAFCHPELFPLLYLPAFVTFRFTDILRGLVAQPIMWKHDYLLGFTNATVIQERNPHNYLKDFESEIPCYLKVEEVIEVATRTVSAQRSVSDNLYEVYRELLNHNIVVQKELKLLKRWLMDIA